MCVCVCVSKYDLYATKYIRVFVRRKTRQLFTFSVASELLTYYNYLTTTEKLAASKITEVRSAQIYWHDRGSEHPQAGKASGGIKAC